MYCFCIFTKKGEKKVKRVSGCCFCPKTHCSLLFYRFFSLLHLPGTTHRDVLQVQMLVVHGLAQLPDFLLHLLHLLCRELILVSRVILVQLEQLNHQLQTGPIQVHVETVPTQDIHEGGRAQSQVLREREVPLLEGFYDEAEHIVQSEHSGVKRD